MRLWSLHPVYLDPAGLVALWRESLLAQQVLLGRTTGYKSHPQLDRFRACPQPEVAIACYLRGVLAEADRRGYRFDAAKIITAGESPKMPVQEGQIAHEWRHLLMKLQRRSPQLYAQHCALPVLHLQPHPMFFIVPGGVEDWERV